MIKQLIHRLLGKRPARSPFGQREEVPASVHGIDPALVDHRAVDVVRTLKRAGFAAYIVGGAVRDLLLGLRPKDFDVATDATPEEVKYLFARTRYRAFIIGKRFRIVHVVYGRGREHEVIEVSTFRAFLDNSQAEQVSGNERTSKTQLARMQHAVDASGRVLRDNVWGPQDQDATRRDFSVNAMYYDPEDQVLVDFHQGIQDAHRRTLRMIGDPATRYREDPVRIIRAVRFAAKLAPLGFRLDTKTARPLRECLPLLAQVPQSRLFDEMLKLLQTGHALSSIEQLRTLGLEQGIYPLLDVVVQRAGQPLVRAALADTDRRVAEGKSVAPSFLLACVLWPDVQAAWQQHLAQGWHSIPALQTAIDDVFDRRIGDVSGRGKLAADMREIWVMQPRFDKRTGNTPLALLAQPRFRAGLDFMLLRRDAGEYPEALADWWQSFVHGDDERRADLLAQAREEQRQQQRAQAAQKPVQPTSKPTSKRPPQQQSLQGKHSPTAPARDTAGDTAGEAGMGVMTDTAADTSTALDASTPPRRRRRRTSTGASRPAALEADGAAAVAHAHDDAQPWPAPSHDRAGTAAQAGNCADAPVHPSAPAPRTPRAPRAPRSRAASAPPAGNDAATPAAAAAHVPHSHVTHSTHGGTPRGEDPTLGSTHGPMHSRAAAHPTSDEATGTTAPITTPATPPSRRRLSSARRTAAPSAPEASPASAPEAETPTSSHTLQDTAAADTGIGAPPPARRRRTAPARRPAPPLEE